MLLALTPIVLFAALAAAHAATHLIAVLGVAAVLGFVWLADNVRAN